MHLPSSVASIIYLGFAAWLFRRDIREKPNVTRAMWLPFFWVFISGTRFISEWMALLGLQVGGSSVEEGSPVDAIFFFGMIGLGFYVLNQRRVSLGEFMRNNRWVTIYIIYCFLAILWSDFPLQALKRWVKLCGQPIMVLIILTEPEPMEALITLFKRLAYICIPVSILFNKYFPQWGRGFSYWTGGGEWHGICLGKNSFGFLCMVLGSFFSWYLLTLLKQKKSPRRKKELILCVSLLVADLWLLNMAQSSTALVSMVIAMALLLFVGFRFINVRNIGTYLLILLVLGATAEGLFKIHEKIIAALGKDTTLTGRTDIWHFLLKADINPVLGSGFESFWMGDEAKHLNALYDAHSVVFNEAHNGYLETYLNLGLLGLALTAGLIGATYAKSRRALIDDFDIGRFRFANMVAILVYNWTEAAFRTHSVPFFVFFLCAIDYPRPAQIQTEESVEAADAEFVSEPNFEAYPQTGFASNDSLSS